jgi:hypothetical protein
VTLAPPARPPAPQAADPQLADDILHFMRYWGVYPPSGASTGSNTSQTYYNNQVRSRFAPYR